MIVATMSAMMPSIYIYIYVHSFSSWLPAVVTNFHTIIGSTRFFAPKWPSNREKNMISHWFSGYPWVPYLQNMSVYYIYNLFQYLYSIIYSYIHLFI